MKQIVIKTNERDLQNFYVNTLGGTVTKNYTLPEKDAILLYNIPMDVNVYELKLQKFKLIILIYEVFEEDSLQHICLNLKNIEEIYSKASKNHYRTYHREKGLLESFYIKDNNNNLFDFKHNLKVENREMTAV